MGVFFCHFVMQICSDVNQWWNNWSILMPVLVLAATPMIIFQLFIRRHIVAGLTAVSLRGWRRDNRIRPITAQVACSDPWNR